MDLEFFKVLYKLYSGKFNTGILKHKIHDMIHDYISIRINFISHLIIAPIVYPIYYIFRNKLNDKIFKYYMEFYADDMSISLSDFEHDMYYSLRYGTQDKRNEYINILLMSLSDIELYLWYSGDMLDVDNTGGMPEDYKPHLPKFWRRWLYSAIRNPFYNYVWVNYVRGPVKDIQTVFDNRNNTVVKTQGLLNHRVGMRLRIYTTENGYKYFYYERTYKSKILGWRTNYSGVVGISDVDEVSIYPLYIWYEHSNRPCEIINEKQ